MKLRPSWTLAVVWIATVARADAPLQILWCDVEGGAATLIVTPAGESVLVDTGMPGERDPARIERIVKETAGLERIDHLVVTHFDIDHYGGAADLSRRVEIGRFYDPGIPEGNERLARRIAPYRNAAEGKRTVLEPGSEISLRQTDGPPLRLQCLGAAQKFVSGGVGSSSNPICSEHEEKAKDESQNANSTVLLLSYGEFRFLDAADLTWNLEKELVCPINVVGEVDVYQVDHHGLSSSNNPVLVKSVKPRVAIMNNGARKGTAPATVSTLRSTPSIEAIYQLHRNVRDPGGNTFPDHIANWDEDCSAEPVLLTVARDGKSYTVSVPSRDHSRTFPTQSRSKP